MAEHATHMRQPVALRYAASGAETPAALGTVDIGFDANTWEFGPSAGNIPGMTQEFRYGRQLVKANELAARAAFHTGLGRAAGRGRIVDELRRA